jgi:hypothetical protein
MPRSTILFQTMCIYTQRRQPWTNKEEADEIDTLFGFSNDRREPIDLTADDDEFPSDDDFWRAFLSF